MTQSELDLATALAAISKGSYEPARTWLEAHGAPAKDLMAEELLLALSAVALAPYSVLDIQAAQFVRDGEEP